MPVSTVDLPAQRPVHGPQTPPPPGETPRLRWWPGIVAVAVLAEIGLRGGVANALVGAAALGLLLIATQTTVAGRRAGPWALAGVVPAIGLGLRASPWVTATDVVLLVGLGSAVSLTRGDLPALGWRGAGRGVVAAAAAAGRAEAAIVERVAGRFAAHTPASAAVLRGLARAVPVLAVVVALLSSADALFADLVVPGDGLWRGVGHAALIAAAALVVVGLLGSFGAAPGHADGDVADERGPDADAPRTGLGREEALTMLGLAVVVLGLFAAAQLWSMTSSGRARLAETGRTPAEHARSGFFQLCWATALLVAYFAAVQRRMAAGVAHLGVVRGVAAAGPLLALVLVAVSAQRLAAYDAAFGLTMLRVWAMGATVWMGVVLCAMALINGSGDGARPATTGLVAASVLVAVANVVNVEAFVARHNLARGAAGRPVDLGYLTRLSDDASGPLSAVAVDPATQVRLLDCGVEHRGAAALNVSSVAADRRRRDLCPALVLAMPIAGSAPLDQPLPPPATPEPTPPPGPTGLGGPGVIEPAAPIEAAPADAPAPSPAEPSSVPVH